jgi:hypothetical protein
MRAVQREMLDQICDDVQVILALCKVFDDGVLEDDVPRQEAVVGGGGSAAAAVYYVRLGKLDEC